MKDIREIDLEERFIRSPGPGGQKVNKTSTCVYLKHIPTGITVKCREERSQLLNRLRARQILAEKIGCLIRRNAGIERERIEKFKRQNRKKPRALKLRILEAKRRHSRKKALRASVREQD
ncbi:MAG: peptide chain release factor-like protein [Candidatus Omnitrophica bacterium]|nr:peptide chain release factor-like protein [Candidatus Omnitrophota bacterium]